MAGSNWPLRGQKLTTCDGVGTSQRWTKDGLHIQPFGTCGSCLLPRPWQNGRMFAQTLDLTVGVVVEASVHCRGNATAGFLVRGESGDTKLEWDCARQLFLQGDYTWDRKTRFPPGEALSLKLLLRSTSDGATGMAELYVNGIIGHPFTFPLGGGNATSLGVLDSSAGAAVRGARAWAMTL